MTYNEAINSSKVVLVEFYASWCPHCQRMMPIVEQVRNTLGDTARVYQYEIDANRTLADAQQIESIPTFIVYRDGEEVWRQSGEMPEQRLLDKVESYTHAMA